MDHRKISDRGIPSADFLVCLGFTGYCKERRETGEPGRSLNIKCSYQDHHAERCKYFCKTIDDRGCDIIVSSEQPTPGRLNLTDYKQQRHFLVTLFELTDEDTGVYWCAVGGASSTDKIELLEEVFISGRLFRNEMKHFFNYDIFHLVLTVWNHHLLSFFFLCPQCASFLIIVDPVYGDEGGSAIFRCPYAQGYQNNTKGLCKGDCDGKGANMLIKSGQAKNTQIHLYDNSTARVYSVTFSALKIEYSGRYTCAVHTEGTYVHTKQELVVRKGK